jgi:hypothetical protein
VQAEGLSVAPEEAADLDDEPTEQLSSPEHFVDIAMNYILAPDGELQVSATVNGSMLVVAVARVGLQLFVKQDLQFVRYYGKGPHENYPVCIGSTSCGMR